jgi:hypothetical protein
LTYSLTFGDVPYALENLKIIIFVSKNWFNDPRLNCKSPCNLIKFIEIFEQLEEKLEELKKG